MASDDCTRPKSVATASAAKNVSIGKPASKYICDNGLELVLIRSKPTKLHLIFQNTHKKITHNNNSWTKELWTTPLAETMFIKICCVTMSALTTLIEHHDVTVIINNQSAISWNTKLLVNSNS